jgi:hypothetical protein
VINIKTGVMVFFYVDDFLLLAPPARQKDIDDLKATLHKKYRIKDLGPIKSFLNISIKRDIPALKAWISQEAYIDKLITEFKLESLAATPIKTPLSTNKFISYEGKASEAEIMAFQRRTGSILYAAVVSRPDIAFAASQLCQFNTNPSPEHRREADRVLGYLAQTKHLAIEYSADTSSSRVFEVSSDASFADDTETRRSTQGYLMTLFNSPIAW